MPDNAHIRYNPSDEAMLRKRLNSLKHETWDQLKRRVDHAAAEGAAEVRSFAGERVGTGDMLRSVGTEVMENTDEKYRVQFGYVNSAPRYPLFQEYGTYGNRILPSYDVQYTNDVDGGGIVPLQSLAHGYLAALDKIQRGWNG